MGYTPPQLDVRKITGGWAYYPPSSVTTDDVIIYPNAVDTKARIELYGAGAAKIVCSSGASVDFCYDTGTIFLKSYYGATDITLEPLTNRNLLLNPTGTGYVKFGTYAAGAATDSTGYITILDAAGNTRKLMVQA